MLWTDHPHLVPVGATVMWPDPCGTRTSALDRTWVNAVPPELRGQAGALQHVCHVYGALGQQSLVRAMGGRPRHLAIIEGQVFVDGPTGDGGL